MAPYVFNRYEGENLGDPKFLNLYLVSLERQQAELSSYETGSSDLTWTYTIIVESHKYYPDTNILVPFDSYGVQLYYYAWDNRNNFFPSDLLGQNWVQEPFERSYRERVELTTFLLPDRSQRQPRSPKPPERWILVFHYEDGYRVRPSYEDLITGYSRDIRFIPDKLKLTSTINQKVKVEYYRNNPYEQIPNLEYIDPDADFVEPIGDGIDDSKSRMKSIDWCVQELTLVKNKTTTINITGIVLGTLRINSPNLLIAGHSEINQIRYPAKYLLNYINYLDELFDYWALLYNDTFIRYHFGGARLLQCKENDRKLRFGYTGLGFNSSQVSLAITEGFNDHWDNYQLPNYEDYLCNPLISQRLKENILLYHPFFKNLPIPGDYGHINVDQAALINYRRRVFDKSNQNYYPFNNANLRKWHLKPQIDNNNKSWGIGSLTMDTIRTIEIHTALNAKEWAVNPDDPTKPRKDNLGWRIQRGNEVLGIRVGTDGKFDPVKEKKIVRQVIPANKKLDAEKVGVNNFGDGGMVVKRINNRFNGDKIESDQCVIIHDLLQLIQENHEQHNLAIGLQESSAIEIKDPKDEKGKNKARFDNQLGLLLEIFNLLSSANEMTRANLISSLITQSQTSEVIAGLGLPSVTKTIPIKIDKKVTQLPYKGIAPHRSISQEVATCTANVGIVLGQLL